jgi:hypothetical protein
MSTLNKRAKLPDDGKLREFLAASEVVVVGRVGTITSTGGSLNANIEVEQVLQGSLERRKARIVLSTINRSSLPALDPKGVYVFGLRKLKDEDVPVFSLAGDDANAVITYDRDVVRYIQDLETGRI